MNSRHGTSTTLRYHDEEYFDKYMKTVKTVEGFDYPYICQICGKFLSKEDTNWCGEADFVMIDGKRYEWVHRECPSKQKVKSVE